MGDAEIDERIARAICDATEGPDWWEHITEDGSEGKSCRGDFRIMARAAREAHEAALADAGMVIVTRASIARVSTRIARSDPWGF